MIKPVKKDYKKIIKTLEEQLIRKQGEIEHLKKENKILLKTAFKNKEVELEKAKGEKDSQ
jgi:hypothetical protein